MTSPPVPPSSRLTSGFGMRLGRTTARPTFHAGIDFLAREGVPVYAVERGRVSYLGRDEEGRRSRTWGYGNVVGLEHAQGGFWTLYAHLSRLVVREGDRVDAGQLLGFSGNTSNGKFPSMGAHFHFEVRRTPPSGRAPIPGPYRTFNVDPEAWLNARGIRVRDRVGFQGLAACPHCDDAHLSGLGDAGDDEGMPDEPVRDLDTYDYSLGLLVGATALTVGSVAASVFLVVQTWKGLRAP